MRHNFRVDSLGNEYWQHFGEDYIHYLKNGLYHREDGPAIEYPDGSKYWYINGHLHREDGPAVDYISGHKEWWYHGQEICCSSNEEFLKLIKLKVFW